MSKNEKIEDFFKNRLEELNDSPDDRVWNTIKTQIQQPKKLDRFLILILFFMALGGAYLGNHLINSESKKIISRKYNSLKFTSKNKEKVRVNSSNTNPPLKNKIDDKKNKSYTPNKKFNTGKKVVKPIILLPNEHNKLDIKSIEPTLIITKVKVDKKRPETNENNITRLELTLSSGLNYYNSNSINTLFSNMASSNNQGEFNAYNFGVSLSYYFNPKIALRLGIYKLNLKNELTIVSDVNPNTFTENIIQNSSIKLENVTENDLKAYINNNVSTLFHEVSYVEIPFEFKSRISSGKFNTHFIAGASVYGLHKNTVYLLNSNGSLNIGYNKFIDSKNASLNLGLSTDFKIFNKVYFSTEAQYKQFLNFHKPIYNNTSTPFNFSISSGIIYRF